ncbi:MAG TPA: class I SAM-dependent methyltransferase [Gaiellaceae bacterium]|nr:class I SAM-dependent methyltransferase [Gaiellaceae bacterium]
MRLDNPLLVRWEFASEERLNKRNAIFRSLVEGAHPDDAAVEAVIEATPARVLDVGCGTGELTERFVRAGSEVQAIDISPRMVELTRARGIDAQIADVESLPFGDREFDCVFAGWVLYHAPALDQAIAECARVLRPGGRLVASTIAEDNLSEVWDLFEDGERQVPVSFNRTNGSDLLRRRFAQVEQRDVDSLLLFPDIEAIRSFVASTIDRAHLAPSMPPVEVPFRAVSRHTVFVAETAA